MSFITFRRYHLDKVLLKTNFYGKVLDVGGKKDNKRGKFRPPLSDVDSWEYVNIDESTNPDYLCSADDIPVDSNTFDVLILAEVLEHLENPISVLKECHRILKQDGKLILTMPFLNAIHADPYDFQRWTKIKLNLELEKLNFKDINIEVMGSLFAVIYDLIHVGLSDASHQRYSIRNRFVRKIILPILKNIFLYLDSKYKYKSKYMTTGYSVEAIK